MYINRHACHSCTKGIVYTCSKERQTQAPSGIRNNLDYLIFALCLFTLFIKFCFRSKKTDLSVCGVLAVCLNVIYAIKNGSTFSLLENAMVANKNDRGFFKNFVSCLFIYIVYSKFEVKSRFYFNGVFF